MLVRLAKLEFKIRKPLFELFGKPWTCGEATDEKCELLMINLEPRSRVSEQTDRICGKPSLEVVLDGVYGRLNRRFEELRNLCAECEKFLV